MYRTLKAFCTSPDLEIDSAANACFHMLCGEAGVTLTLAKRRILCHIKGDNDQQISAPPECFSHD